MAFHSATALVVLQ